MIQIWGTKCNICSQGICLSLVILQIPYLWLLYKYVRWAYHLHQTKAYTQYDHLDYSIIVLSWLCLLMIPFMLLWLDLMNTLLEIVKIFWYFVMLCIYYQLSMDGCWVQAAVVSGLLYVGYLGYVNVMYEGIVVPVSIPMLVVSVVCVVLSVPQHVSIHYALREASGTARRVLRSRQRFLVLSCGGLVVSEIAAMAAQPIRDLFGSLIYVLMEEFLEMLVIYYTLMNPVTKEQIPHMMPTTQPLIEMEELSM